MDSVDSEPINYEDPKFKEQWEMRPVQFPLAIEPVQDTPPQEVEAQMVTRGQKQRMEQKEEAEKRRLGEGLVGEGSGKNDTIIEQEKEMDADTESLSDWQSAWDGYFKERRKEAEKVA